MTGNSLNQNKMNHFRHVWISSDEFDVHDPKHTGMVSPSSRGPNQAIQIFNQKIAMANGAHFGDPRYHDGTNRVPEKTNQSSQI